MFCRNLSSRSRSRSLGSSRYGRPPLAEQVSDAAHTVKSSTETPAKSASTSQIPHRLANFTSDEDLHKLDRHQQEQHQQQQKVLKKGNQQATEQNSGGVAQSSNSSSKSTHNMYSSHNLVNIINHSNNSPQSHPPLGQQTLGDGGPDEGPSSSLPSSSSFSQHNGMGMMASTSHHHQHTFSQSGVVGASDGSQSQQQFPGMSLGGDTIATTMSTSAVMDNSDISVHHQSGTGTTTTVEQQNNHDPQQEDDDDYDEEEDGVPVMSIETLAYHTDTDTAEFDEQSSSSADQQSASANNQHQNHYSSNNNAHTVARTSILSFSSNNGGSIISNNSTTELAAATAKKSTAKKTTPTQKSSGISTRRGDSQQKINSNSNQSKNRTGLKSGVSPSKTKTNTSTKTKNKPAGTSADAQEFGPVVSSHATSINQSLNISPMTTSLSVPQSQTSSSRISVSSGQRHRNGLGPRRHQSPSSQSVRRGHSSSGGNRSPNSRRGQNKLKVNPTSNSSAVAVGAANVVRSKQRSTTAGSTTDDSAYIAVSAGGGGGAAAIITRRELDSSSSRRSPPRPSRAASVAKELQVERTQRAAAEQESERLTKLLLEQKDAEQARRVAAEQQVEKLRKQLELQQSRSSSSQLQQSGEKENIAPMASTPGASAPVARLASASSGTESDQEKVSRILLRQKALSRSVSMLEQSIRDARSSSSINNDGNASGNGGDQLHRDHSMSPSRDLLAAMKSLLPSTTQEDSTIAEAAAAGGDGLPSWKEGESPFPHRAVGDSLNLTPSASFTYSPSMPLYHQQSCNGLAALQQYQRSSNDFTTPSRRSTTSSRRAPKGDSRAPKKKEGESNAVALRPRGIVGNDTRRSFIRAPPSLDVHRQQSGPHALTVAPHDGEITNEAIFTVRCGMSVAKRENVANLANGGANMTLFQCGDLFLSAGPHPEDPVLLRRLPKISSTGVSLEKCASFRQPLPTQLSPARRSSALRASRISTDISPTCSHNIEQMNTEGPQNPITTDLVMGTSTSSSGDGSCDGGDSFDCVLTRVWDVQYEGKGTVGLRSAAHPNYWLARDPVTNTLRLLPEDRRSDHSRFKLYCL